ncbi:hypothetical protein [Micromonospora sp. C32]|uniref:hypothetical protein n=1 Tax=unclassified Micromonospora TaxID=2617518 RepID=UPI001B35911C|nr:hypothetical protein [Micromonospora sp. C32]MBQ1055144.1 hypothetical protein [Micromonospora sp. C32]
MPEGLVGVHAYWQVSRSHPRGYRQLVALTWLLSILSWQRHAGPMELFADEPTVEWLDSIGHLQHYDRVTRLDDTGLDDRYDRATCFALPKLLALERHPTAVLVDTDAYLLAPLRLSGPGSHFAHLESGDVDFYANLRALSNPAGVDLPDNLDLVGNTSLFRAADAGLARRISAAGLAFLAHNPTTPGRDVHLHMTVAEQVLATHLTLRSGAPMANIFGAVWRFGHGWLTAPPAYGHLWHVKRAETAEDVVVAFQGLRQHLAAVYGVDDERIRSSLRRA